MENRGSITEKYTVCMLKEKKNLYRRDLTPFCIISMLIEMMLEGSIDISEKNEVTLNPKKPAAEYNQKLYEVIESRKKNKITVRYILSDICYSLSYKNLKSIMALLQEDLVRDGYVTVEVKSGLLGRKENLKVEEEKFKSIIEEVKTDFLQNKTLSEDMILLASLLNSINFLKNVFSKYEKQEVEERLKEVKETEIAQKVKVADTLIRSMIASDAVLVVGVSSTV